MLAQLPDCILHRTLSQSNPIADLFVVWIFCLHSKLQEIEDVTV